MAATGTQLSENPEINDYQYIIDVLQKNGTKVYHVPPADTKYKWVRQVYSRDVAGFDIQNEIKSFLAYLPIIGEVRLRHHEIAHLVIYKVPSDGLVLLTVSFFAVSDV